MSAATTPPDMLQTTNSSMMQESGGESRSWIYIDCYWYRFTPSEYDYFLNNIDFDLFTAACDIVQSKFFFIWFFFITGLLGNVVVIVTFLSMKRSPAMFYIAILAACDGINAIVDFVNHINFSYRVEMSTIGCKIIYGLMDYFVTLSSWMLVVIALERFFAIAFPLKKNAFLTMRRAQISVAILMIILLPCVIRFVMMYSDSGGWCVTSWTSGIDIFIYMYITQALVFWIPIASVVILCILLIVVLAKGRRERRKLTKDSADTMQKQLQQVDRAERGITVMVIVTVITFVILNLPICLYNWLVDHYYYDQSAPNDHIYFRIYMEIAFRMRTFNFSINVFLYFLTNKKFRDQLKYLLTCKKFRK